MVGHELAGHELARQERARLDVFYWCCPVCSLPLAAGGPVELARAAARHWQAWTETHGHELPTDLEAWGL